ncbi:MAG: alanine--tRNA ligase [Patescibacteria group bacterium]
MITTKELKEKYLKFFEERGHKIIPSASLIPENDPGALFISAGMHPLVPYLLGEKHPMGDRLVNSQKCIRTIDIDEVGDNWHLTFFEMLGNWGLGSYWKEESIKMSWEFLTKELNLPIEKLSVTCFKGDPSSSSGQAVPKDEISAKTWESLGIPKNKIKFLGKEDNWWGQSAGGPCGPDTEIFYDGVEIWNNVFMEFNKTADGKLEPLKQKNVDTGMGLERTTAILNGYNNVYEIDTFKPIMDKIKDLLPSINLKSQRIIADHIKASVFLLFDGVEPSNKDQGYILRRLIRRAIVYTYTNDKNFDSKNLKSVAQKVIDVYKNDYREFELEDKCAEVLNKLSHETRKFRATIEKGLKEFVSLYEISRSEKKLELISGKDAFNLYQTYGFPIEITEELAKEKGIKIDKEKFQKEFEQHQELSRTATAGKFKSGLADNSEQVVKYHTATHLLLATLRKVLGDHVFQKGSNITAERLRLDFSHSEKMTADQLKQVEDAVNEVIIQNLPVNCVEVSLEKAKEIGAMGVFESKYGDMVKVYTIGGAPSTASVLAFSQEICSGPHVQKTGELGHFKILKEEASSSGVRRIKAILE